MGLLIFWLANSRTSFKHLQVERGWSPIQVLILGLGKARWAAGSSELCWLWSFSRQVLEEIAAKFNLKKINNFSSHSGYTHFRKWLYSQRILKQCGLAYLGFKNILPINLLKCCHKSPATHPGKILYVSLLITCMPSADLKNRFLNVCKISYV